MCTCPGFHTVIYLTEMDKIENKLADMSPDQLSQNAQHIWQMLDDMAENNPAAYRKFIDRQMEESKKHNAKKYIVSYMNKDRGTYQVHKP